MLELLNEREAELICEQKDACERLSAELSNAYVDQVIVANMTQRIQRISGRITEIQSMKRYCKNREVK
jgi:hypothetical protein